MEKVSFIYLSQEDVVGLNLDLHLSISIIEKTFKEHAQKQVEIPPKPGIHPQEGSFIHAMPAYLKDSKICGIKWVSGFPSNHKLNLPQILGILILNDIKTGLPIAVMDCRWITAVRTGAVTAITAKYCAKKNSDVLGIIGAGIQARYQLKLIEIAMPFLQELIIFDINTDISQQFLKDMESQTKLKIRIGKSLQETVENSDIIVTATQRMKEPIIKDEWFKAGSLGCPLESGWAWEKETIEGVDKFITDDYNQMKYFASQGAIKGNFKFYAEVGEIVVGKKKGRENDKERILAINEGLAIFDIALANQIYLKAKKENKGQTLTLMESNI